MRTYLIRFLRLLLGLFIYALGTVFTIQANVGLAPWEALHLGLSDLTGLSFGVIVILVGLVILIATVAMKEPIGIGTVANVFMIGLFCDWINYLHIIPLVNNFWLGILVMLLGMFLISLASYFYIGSGFGAGPRDSLMIALQKRLPKVPIGLIRGTIEGTALLIGWLLGSKVGLGTVLAVFGISFVLQFTFKMLRFDVKQVKQESLLETVRNLSALRKS